MCNIQTIGEILEFKDLRELSRLSGISPKVLGKIQLKARALVNHEIIQLEPFTMHSEKLIYLDIETVPKWDKVWLIGFLIDGEFTQLYAEDYDDERRILSEFLKIIGSYRENIFVTWTGFDTRVLRKRMQVHGLYAGPFRRLGHVDLKYEIRRSFIFPTRGYALKRLGGFLGYPFSNPHLDGLTVSTQYQDHIERGDPLDPRAFVYNEDDVKVLPYIESWARERVRR
jgi:predicted RecB family nuclease